MPTLQAEKKIKWNKEIAQASHSPTGRSSIATVAFTHPTVGK